MNQTLKNRLLTHYGPWAVVTGASSGIGEAFADHLAQAGLNLVLVARREQKLNRIGERLKSAHGISYRVVQADLAQRQAADQVFEATEDLNIGLLVASAGYGTTGNFVESGLDQELNMLDVNCRALLVLAHRFGARFADQQRGGLILLSSILAFQGGPNSAHYAATKGYV